MASIVLPAALRLRQDSDLPSEFHVEAETVGAAFTVLVSAHPQVRGALFEDDGSLRPLLRLFVDDEPLDVHGALQSALRPESEIFLLMPIAGG